MRIYDAIKLTINAKINFLLESLSKKKSSGKVKTDQSKDYFIFYLLILDSNCYPVLIPDLG